MCDVEPNLISFTGTGAAIGALLGEGVWHSLPCVEELRLRPPVQFSYADAESAWGFDDTAPSHALLRHNWGTETLVADRIQSELLLRGHRVLVEPVHPIGLCAAPGGGVGPPSVTISAPFPNVSATVPHGTAGGSRVAVVDSGDLNQKSQMVDFVGGLARTCAADDVLGHGTAVAEVIRRVNSNATVSALRVVNASNGTSYELLCAMTYALWSGLFDVVNVSLSTQMAGGCMTVLGGSLTMVLDICRQSGRRLPLIVAAAGNATSGQYFGYPARLPGALVVLAWDSNGTAANYNVTVPPQCTTHYATGGDTRVAFGTITSPAGATQSMYGTSFAAAVATAFLVP